MVDSSAERSTWDGMGFTDRNVKAKGRKEGRVFAICQRYKREYSLTVVFFSQAHISNKASDWRRIEQCNHKS